MNSKLLLPLSFQSTPCLPLEQNSLKEFLYIVSRSSPLLPSWTIPNQDFCSCHSTWKVLTGVLNDLHTEKSHGQVSVHVTFSQHLTKDFSCPSWDTLFMWLPGYCTLQIFFLTCRLLFLSLIFWFLLISSFKVLFTYTTFFDGLIHPVS